MTPALLSVPVQFLQFLASRLTDAVHHGAFYREPISDQHQTLGAIMEAGRLLRDLPPPMEPIQPVPRPTATPQPCTEFDSDMLFQLQRADRVRILYRLYREAVEHDDNYLAVLKSSKADLLDAIDRLEQGLPKSLPEAELIKLLHPEPDSGT